MDKLNLVSEQCIDDAGFSAACSSKENDFQMSTTDHVTDSTHSLSVIQNPQLKLKYLERKKKDLEGKNRFRIKKKIWNEKKKI